MESVSTERLIESSLQELIEEYCRVRSYSEELCAPLSVEDYTPQAVVFASPPKWHLAHTNWFFEEMILSKYQEDYQCYDESYGYLFNSYYNAVGERIGRDERGLITRPNVDEVYAYRRHIDELMVAFLEKGVSQQMMDLVVLGLNHEQQHQELLLTDLKYTLSRNPTYPVYKEDDFELAYNETTGWLSIEEGLYEIGHNGSGFAFDNEFGRHKVYLHEASVSKALVTNGEFLEFIESGGYQNHEYWLDEGWAWVNAEQIKVPLYWHCKDGQWYQYTLSGFKEIDPEAILTHVSFYEAAAFAAYKKARLLTEFEWEVIANQLNWGDRWEWTNSAYLPYPGFKIADGAVGEYNGKFMVNQMVLRGGSVATSKGHSRKTYRNFFHPEMRWQFNGIRLAR